MRRVRPALLALLLLLVPGVAAAQTVVDQAADALRRDPVYVDASAERGRDVDAGRLRESIRSGKTPLFVAVLPASAVEEAGGDPRRLVTRLGERVGLSGTYAVLAGNSLRAASTLLAPGRADSIAAASFPASSGEGSQAVLATFIERIQREAAAAPSGSGGASNEVFPEGRATGSDKGGGGTWLLVLLLAGGVVLAVVLTSRGRKKREEARKQIAADRKEVAAELSVLAGDVVALEDQVDLHPAARPDYDAAVMRYQAAQAAIEGADDAIDLERVRRVVDEGRYAMNRARAVTEGRDPPPPPPELARPGSRNEPALEVDERGQPFYAGAGVPFYGGGGWFGGSGLFTGFLLGSMMGGGFGGWGGGYHDHGDHGGGDGGDGGGDGGGDFGGGDFGGGDFGGGDFGGGDFGGGDFGGGDFG